MRTITLLVAAGLLLVAAAAPASNAAICTRSQGCEFWDNEYHEYILNDIDTPVYDVVIVPSASPFATRDLRIVEQSIQAWEDGVRAEAAPWLASQFDMRIYTLGVDPIPPEALSDPEVVVIAAEYNPFLLFGIGLTLPVGFCSGFNPLDSTQWHQHEGSQWAVQTQACKSGGTQCVALNTNFLLGGANRMYDLVAHEFGHCLGIGHVGDALDFDAKTVPMQDIMSYQYTPSQVHCVSTLNVRSIEGVLAKSMGQSSSLWLDSGDFYDMNPGAYDQVTCPNPSGSLL